MTRFKLAAILLLLAVLIRSERMPQPADCGIPNTAFQSGEVVSFSVFYHAAGIYVDAGKASFSVSLETLNNKPVYHIVGDGRTNPAYDIFYRVRDRYESWVDTATLLPFRFARDVSEGSTRKQEQVSFNRKNNTAVTRDSLFRTPLCVQDILSAIFYARNIDFSLLQPNDKITFPLFLDNELFEMYIRYLGRETITTQYGRFRAIKFKPLLLEGTIFSGGENMTVWVTDDANHIPVRIESPIIVGSIKVDMMSYSGIRHPLKALIRRE